jgi:hypothetical protein
MTNENPEPLLGVNRPTRPPSGEPLEEHGIVTDVILPAVAAAVGTAIGNQVPKIKKDK